MKQVSDSRENLFCILHSAFCIWHADVAQQRQQQFRKLPGASPHESASLSIGPI